MHARATHLQGDGRITQIGRRIKKLPIKLRREIEKEHLEVRYERQHSGIVYFTMMRVMRPLLLKRRGLHAAVHGIDDTCARLLGRFLPPFRPRALLMALKSREIHLS